MLYLTLKPSHLEIRLYDKPSKVIKVKTREEFKSVLAKYPKEVVVSSSSLDFPKEYTADKVLIALCKSIRKIK